MQSRNRNPFLPAAAAFAVAFLVIAGFLGAPMMAGHDGSWADAWHRGAAPQLASVAADRHDQDVAP